MGNAFLATEGCTKAGKSFSWLMQELKGRQREIGGRILVSASVK